MCRYAVDLDSWPLFILFSTLSFSSRTQHADHFVATYKSVLDGKVREKKHFVPESLHILYSWPQIIRTVIKIVRERGHEYECGDSARSVQRLGIVCWPISKEQIKRQGTYWASIHDPVFGLFFLHFMDRPNLKIATKWWTASRPVHMKCIERKVYAERVSTISGPGESPQRKEEGKAIHLFGPLPWN